MVDEDTQDFVALLRSREAEDALRQLMDSYVGRMFVHTLLQRAGHKTSPFAAGMPDVTSYGIGQRDLAQWVEDWALKVHPKACIIMRTEAETREQRYRQLLENAEEQDDG